MSQQERLLNYAREFKEKAALSEKLFSTVETKMIPELKEKYKEFVEAQIDYGTSLEILKHHTLESQD